MGFIVDTCFLPGISRQMTDTPGIAKSISRAGNHGMGLFGDNSKTIMLDFCHFTVDPAGAVSDGFVADASEADSLTIYREG